LDDVTKVMVWFYHSMNTCDWKDLCPCANGFALAFAVNGGLRKKKKKTCWYSFDWIFYCNCHC